MLVLLDPGLVNATVASGALRLLECLLLQHSPLTVAVLSPLPLQLLSTAMARLEDLSLHAPNHPQLSDSLLMSNGSHAAVSIRARDSPHTSCSLSTKAASAALTMKESDAAVRARMCIHLIGAAYALSEGEVSSNQSSEALPRPPLPGFEPLSQEDLKVQAVQALHVLADRVSSYALQLLLNATGFVGSVGQTAAPQEAVTVAEILLSHTSQHLGAAAVDEDCPDVQPVQAGAALVLGWTGSLLGALADSAKGATDEEQYTTAVVQAKLCTAAADAAVALLRANLRAIEREQSDSSAAPMHAGHAVGALSASTGHSARDGGSGSGQSPGADGDTGRSKDDRSTGRGINGSDSNCSGACRVHGAQSSKRLSHQQRMLVADATAVLTVARAAVCLAATATYMTTKQAAATALNLLSSTGTLEAAAQVAEQSVSGAEEEARDLESVTTAASAGAAVAGTVSAAVAEAAGLQKLQDDRVEQGAQPCLSAFLQSVVTALAKVVRQAGYGGDKREGKPASERASLHSTLPRLLTLALAGSAVSAPGQVSTGDASRASGGTWGLGLRNLDRRLNIARWVLTWLVPVAEQLREMHAVCTILSPCDLSSSFSPACKIGRAHV